MLDAHLWDNMHYLFRSLNDRMIHASFCYDFRLDAEILKHTFEYIFREVPVLHASFKGEFFRSYWSVAPYQIDQVLTFKEIDEADLEQSQDDFLCGYIEPDAPIQMLVTVFYHGGKSTICILVNHMCMDGGSLKYFLSAMCKIYNNIASGAPEGEIKMGNRSHMAVYECLSPDARKAALRLFKNINTKDDDFFPLAPSTPEDHTMLIRRKLPSGMLRQLHEVAQKRKATMNDLLLAAYFHSLYEIAGFADDRKISISCAIDLRRHLKGEALKSITNHTSWMQCEVQQKGARISDTLDSAKQSADNFKSDPYMGLHGFPLISLIFRIFPHAVAEKLIFTVYSNPPCALSNIGRIDIHTLNLQGHEPIDGFITGAVKYKPYILLSMSTLGDEMTLAICTRGNDKDREIINHFFDVYIQNLKTLIAEIEETPANS